MVSKRPANEEEATSRSIRRVKPTATSTTAFSISNLDDGETVHVACLLIDGQCPSYSNSATDYISVLAVDSFGTRSVQNWPVCNGKWRALVASQCGKNELTIDLHHAGGVADTLLISFCYQPLLQVPPLHLAILVAKDSLLRIDCPPSKYGAFPAAHSGLDAVVSKFRTTALMWQAMTAEALRENGLGKRSFRLEEEWTADPWNSNHQVQLRNLPKVHIVRTEKTVAQLQSIDLAQRNRSDSHPDGLHAIFVNALKIHGPPFDCDFHPSIAGLILDASYDADRHLVLGHAALCSNNDNGFSLGIFGSHLTYAWPRYLAEVADCLTDVTPPGDTVSNDDKKCNTIGEVCSIGQGAFLREVGYALGAGPPTSTTEGGYYNWAHNFIGHGVTEQQESKWDLEDALKFKTSNLFQHPDDSLPTRGFLNASIQCEVTDSDEGQERLKVTSAAGLARMTISNGNITNTVDLMPKAAGQCSEFRITDFSRYNRSAPLRLSALAMNGTTKEVKDVWRLLGSNSSINIPGSDVRLRKQSIKSPAMDSNDFEEDRHVSWTVLLSKRNACGSVTRATAIDLRVGCTLDGAQIFYGDGSSANCGPTYFDDGTLYSFGGHASEKHDIPKKAKIVKIEIGERGGWSGLDGIRMTLDNGESWGCLNADAEHDRVEVLEPGSDEKIVGFFGTSGTPHYDFTKEFGIITAPKSFKLPDVVYDLAELRSDDLRKSDKSGGDELTDGEDSDSQSTVS